MKEHLLVEDYKSPYDMGEYAVKLAWENIAHCNYGGEGITFELEGNEKKAVTVSLVNYLRNAGFICGALHFDSFIGRWLICISGNPKVNKINYGFKMNGKPAITEQNK